MTKTWKVNAGHANKAINEKNLCRLIRFQCYAIVGLNIQNSAYKIKSNDSACAEASNVILGKIQTMMVKNHKRERT